MGRGNSEVDPALELLVRAWDAALEAADPGAVIRDFLPEAPRGRLVILAAGKAAARMADAAVRHYGEGATVEGLVVVPHGFPKAQSERLHTLSAGHPVPDEDSRAAAARMLARAAECGAEDRLLVLISGGGSALLSSPLGVTPEEKSRLTEELLRSGADIGEMNTVRKHLSGIKGGRLALAGFPAPVTSLILSDVVGDDLSTVASGPTVPDDSTFADALDVLERYGLESSAARAHFEAGEAGRAQETPGSGDTRFARVENHLVGSNQRSLEAAARALEAGGYTTHILSSAITGEARTAGALHAAIARQVLEHGQPFKAPCALLSGGETTVTVRGSGRGGRNSEFALGMLLALPANAPVWALVADSDGKDGSEENAGVVISPELLQNADRQEARALLDANDSYGLFARREHLLVSGPTGTNVNDIRIVLLGGAPGEWGAG